MIFLLTKYRTVCRVAVGEAKFPVGILLEGIGSLQILGHPDFAFFDVIDEIWPIFADVFFMGVDFKRFRLVGMFSCSGSDADCIGSDVGG